MFLGRRPAEPVDEELHRFHLDLIGATASLRRGAWALCDGSGWPADSSYTQLLAWSWIDDEQRSLVVINFADAPAAARIHPPWDDLAERTWRLDDLLSGEVFVRDGTEIATSGLYVQLAPWAFHVFAVHDERAEHDEHSEPARAELFARTGGVPAIPSPWRAPRRAYSRRTSFRDASRLGEVRNECTI